jgi:hypothetical protein
MHVHARGEEKRRTFASIEKEAAGTHEQSNLREKKQRTEHKLQGKHLIEHNRRKDM